MNADAQRIIIRPAAQDDLALVVAITDAAYTRYIPLMGRKPQPMVTDYQPMIAAGGVWLLEVDGQPAGVLVLADKDDHLLIYNVAIHPDFQKRGLGRRLLDWAEQQTLEAGYNLLRLYTNALMTQNIALYTRLSYVETGREAYLGSSIVHMEKRLKD